MAVPTNDHTPHTDGHYIENDADAIVGVHADA
jgi:hypothetical protein